MRILCFGDSLALPREGCLYSDTWIAKLKEVFLKDDFICDFKGGMLISNLFHSWHQYYKQVFADVVILQEGVCDCAPRYVNDNKLFWKVIISFCEKTRMSKLFWKMVKLRPRRPSCTHTSISSFANKYEELICSMYEEGVKYVVIIKIGHGAPSVVRKSIHFNTNVDAYNNVFVQLKDKFKERLILVDPLNQVEDDMFVDGYHCNAKGMHAVFCDLNNVLSTIVH